MVSFNQLFFAMSPFFFVLLEPFMVAYVQTTYTVLESEGHVDVCVNLSFPEMDILDETLRVEAVYDVDSAYIPPGAVLASMSPLYKPSYLQSPDLPFSSAPNFPDMDPLRDYEEQIRGDMIINATRRVVCFNQLIYDDIRLEESEYVGLTLAVRDASVRTEVQPMYDQLAIKIIDNDGKVHFTQNVCTKN